MTSRKITDVRRQMPLALRAAYMALHRRTDAALAVHGITADQFVLLTTLANGGKALTQRELARRMPSDPSTVRAMLVILERRGLVRRDPHPTDTRARSVELTAAGRRKHRQLWVASGAIRDEMVAALGTGRSRILVTLLLRIGEALNLQGNAEEP